MWLLTVLGSLLLVQAFAAKTNYDEEEAKRLLFLSASAYGSQSNQEACLAAGFKSEEDWKLYSSFEGNCDSLAITGIKWSGCGDFIVYSEKKQELIVVFRGTNKISQLIIESTQTALPQKEFHGYGRVNPYFGEAHERIWADTEKALKDPKFAGYKVLFTGHSLGGALATLGAAHAEAEGLRSGDKIKVVTFGEPRVGSYHFAQEFDRKIPESYRVVNQQDVVPHVGPCQKRDTEKGLLTGLISGLPVARRWYPCVKDGDLFYHHGFEIWYSGTMSSYKECERGEDFECSEGHIQSHLLAGLSKIDNHAHYFGYMVPLFGQAGCKASPSNTDSSSIISVSGALHGLGFLLG